MACICFSLPFAGGYLIDGNGGYGFRRITGPMDEEEVRKLAEDLLGRNGGTVRVYRIAPLGEVSLAAPLWENFTEHGGEE